MKRFVLLAFTFVLCVSARNSVMEPHPPGREFDRTVTVGGIAHTFHLYVPGSCRAGRPTPVILFFHGGGGNAVEGEETVGLRLTADAHGFLLVEPEGYDGDHRGHRTWNAGSCCAGAVRDRVDHVAATRAILDAVAKEWTVDRDRVYATGHSNGGMMAYRLACELSDRIAAIAPNSSYLMLAACKPARPVPVFHMHGLADTCAPFEGGPSTGVEREVRPPVRASIATFVAANGCKSPAATTYKKGAATCVTYGGCRNNADVTLCTVAGEGHAWPGGQRYRLFTRAQCGGTGTKDLDANEAMWTFFMAHPMPHR